MQGRRVLQHATTASWERCTASDAAGAGSAPLRPQCRKPLSCCARRAACPHAAAVCHVERSGAAANERPQAPCKRATARRAAFGESQSKHLCQFIALSDRDPSTHWRSLRMTAGGGCTDSFVGRHALMPPSKTYAVDDLRRDQGRRVAAYGFADDGRAAKCVGMARPVRKLVAAIRILRTKGRIPTPVCALARNDGGLHSCHYIFRGGDCFT